MAVKPSTFRFPGVTSPNNTPVPDEFLDELLPVLSGAELKVLLYVSRRTFGFKRDSDNISLSQMLNGLRTRDGRLSTAASADQEASAWRDSRASKSNRSS